MARQKSKKLQNHKNMSLQYPKCARYCVKQPLNCISLAMPTKPKEPKTHTGLTASLYGEWSLISWLVRGSRTRVTTVACRSCKLLCWKEGRLRAEGEGALGTYLADLQRTRFEGPCWGRNWLFAKLFISPHLKQLTSPSFVGSYWMSWRDYVGEKKHVLGSYFEGPW